MSGSKVCLTHVIFNDDGFLKTKGDFRRYKTSVYSEAVFGTQFPVNNKRLFMHRV